MTEENKKNKKTPELRRKRHKRLILGSFGITAILISLFFIFFLIYGNVLLKNFIIKTVEYRSAGMYRVELEEIKVNFQKLGFEVNQFHLVPDQAIYRLRKSRGEVKTGLYDIRVPHFEVKGLKLLTAFYENSFIIESFAIDNPELRLLDIPIFRNSTNYREGYDDIRPIIVDLVEYFLVRDLKINDGVFDIFLEKEGQVENFTASKISLRLKNFQIDKKNPEGQEKFLYSDGAQLTFKDYKLVLNDGVHVINANEIGLNTIDSIVYARGFSLNPSQVTPAKLKESKKSYFTIFFPEILLSGADIIKAYEKDTFNIRKLLVLRPKINYFNQTPLFERVKTNKTLKNQVNFFPLIKGYLNEVTIMEFDLKKGSFRYGEPLEKVPENIKINGIDVYLDEFKVDSSAYLSSESIMYSKNMELDFSSFEMSLRDSVHILQAKSLFISSKEKVLRAKGLQIRPLKNFNKSIKKDQLDILLPEIEINGLDLFSMYLKGELIAHEFFVNKPVVNIKIKKKGKSKADSTENKSASDIYNLFSRHLNFSKIDRININNGSIDFDQTVKGKNEEIIADNISLTLYNFFLDSINFVTGNNFLFSENIDFELKDYDFLLPNEVNEIKVGLFEFSSKNQEINLSEISMKALRKDNIRERLISKNKSGFLEFDIPSMKFENADIIRALNKREILVENIIINKPHLYSYKIAGIAKDTALPPSVDMIKKEILQILPFVSVKNLFVNEGEISAYIVKRDSIDLNFTNRLQLELGELRLVPDSLSSEQDLFFSKRIKTLVQNQKIILNDGLHQINSDSMVFTFPEKQLIINGFTLKPVEKNGEEYDESIGINIISPLAVFEGFDIQKFYNNQILNVSSGSFDTLLVVLNQRKEKSVYDSSDSRDLSMPRIMKELNLNRLNINHGNFEYYNIENEKIADAEFKGQVTKSSLTNNTLGKKVEKLPFEEFRFILPRFTFNAKDLNHTIDIDSIHFNLGKNEISTKEIRINVDSSFLDSINLSKSQYSIASFDSVNIKGIDFHGFYVDRNANLERLSLWNPIIDFHHYSDSSSKPSLKKIDLYPALSNYVNELSVGEIIVHNGEVKRFNHQLDSNQLRASLDKIYINFSDFRIDSISLERDRFLFSEDLHFRVKDYSKILPGEMNRIIFDELGLSTGESKIYAKGTHLKPLYDDYNYSRILGFQSDRVEAVFKDIEINGVDLEKLYQNNELRAGELLIDSFFIDDFRDKRVEFDEDFRPPMIHEVIREIPVLFSIDSVHLLRGNAKYREFALGGEKPGEIFFNDINSKIYLVSNDSNYFTYKPPTFMYAIGKLMNQGDIIMSGNFNLLDTNNTFSIRGGMGVMDMTAVNPMVENVAFISIKSGVSRSINFNFNADEDYAKGNLNFRYSKFKIFVINKKTGEAEGIDEGIVSWIANTFLINTKNPHLGFFKEGEVFFRRDKNKSIVNYVWKSIYSGIKTSIGAQTQKKLHKIAEKEEKAAKKK